MHELAIKNNIYVKYQRKEGLEPSTFRLEVGRAIHCATCASHAFKLSSFAYLDFDTTQMINKNQSINILQNTISNVHNYQYVLDYMFNKK